MKKPAATKEQKKTEIEQLSQAQLVEMVLGLQKIIEELQEKLAIATGKSRTTSQTSSKPPSTDLIQKSEKPTVQPEADQKKKPGGQPGHQGKTRKGFGRVDRTEISSPDICLNCGSKELSEVINIHSQQVATLVAKPIEVVEYQTQSCKCLECGAVVRGKPPSGIVPGQDLSVNLQALLVWLGNYGHLSYAKLTLVVVGTRQDRSVRRNTPKNQSTSSSSSQASYRRTVVLGTPTIKRSCR